MRFVVFVLGLGLASLTNAASLFTKYRVDSITITDLGTLGGDGSLAYDINEGGDIVGWAQDATNKQHAVAWFDGLITDLHGATPAFSSAVAYSINDYRDVVGYYAKPGSSAVTRAFKYSPGGWLAPLPGQIPAPRLLFDWYVRAYAINNSGRIAGGAWRIKNPLLPPPPDTADICYEILPIQWIPGVVDPQALFCIADPDGDNQWDYGGAEGVQPQANDVNEAGNFVGTDGDTTPWSMFLYKDGVRIAVPPPATATNFTLDGKAQGMNNQNWVTGTYGWPDGSANLRAFVWDGVSANSTSLGALPGGTHSYGEEINEQNMVVGSSGRSYGVDFLRDAGFIWHSNFGMKQLPGLSGQLGFSGGLWYWMYDNCAANSLNDRKSSSGLVQVVGWCMKEGKIHAVRWDVTISLQPLIIAAP